MSFMPKRGAARDAADEVGRRISAAYDAGYAKGLKDGKRPAPAEPASAPQAEVATDTFRGNALSWAVDRWTEDVKNRPMVNIYRPGMDKAWRQVIRYFGGDPEQILGPDHKAQALAARPSAPGGAGSDALERVSAALDACLDGDAKACELILTTLRGAMLATHPTSTRLEKADEIIRQLIACHEEPTCPAIAVALEFLEEIKPCGASCESTT